MSGKRKRRGEQKKVARAIDRRSCKGRGRSPVPYDVYEVRVYNPAVRRTQYVGRFDSLEDARNARDAFEREHSRSRKGANYVSRETVEEAVERYLARPYCIERGKKVSRPPRDSTRETNAYALRGFAAEFGEMDVTAVSAQVLDRWIAQQCVYVVEGVRCFFNWWLADTDSEMRNPLRKWAVRKYDGRADRPVPSTATVWALVEAARACRPGLLGERLAALLVLLAFSGLRPSEAFALRSRDLDFANSRIAVRGQLDRNRKLTPCKNGRARTLVMSPETKLALGALVERLESEDEFLFQTATGKAFTAKSTWHYYWNPIRHRVEGQSTLGVYWLRHHCATLLSRNGATDALVAAQLGHSDAGRLARALYIHRETERDLADIQSAMFEREHEVGEAVPLTEAQEEDTLDGLDSGF